MADLEHLESIVKTQQRRTLFFTVGTIAVSSLCAVALISYAAWYAQRQFDRAATAQREAMRLEERVGELKDRVGELTEISDGLASKIDTRNKEGRKIDPVLTKLVNSLQYDPTVKSVLGDAAAETIAEAKSVQAALIEQKLIRIEFHGAIDRDTMRGLQASLQASGFIAPGSERIAGDYVNGVSYSRPEDRAAADKVASIVRDYFALKCPPAHEFPVSQGPPAKPVPQIIVRAYFSCAIK